MAALDEFTPVSSVGLGSNLANNSGIGTYGPTPNTTNNLTDGTSPGSLLDGELSADLQQTGTIYNGKTTFDNTVSGYILGLDFSVATPTAKFYIGSTTNYLNWDGSSLTIAGSLTASSINIPDTTTANSFHVDSSGNAWWGATTLGSAVAKVTAAGAATFTNVTLTGVQSGSSIDGQYLLNQSVTGSGNGSVTAFNVGPTATGTGGTDATVGSVTWTNPNNVTTNSTYATVALTGVQESFYLTATNFGFSIPSDATIVGILVQVTGHFSGSFSGSSSELHRIIKGGVVGSSGPSINHSLSFSSDGISIEGSATELWGTTWLASDINASNFGYAMALNQTSGSGTETYSVKYITITVYYTDTIGKIGTNAVAGINIVASTITADKMNVTQLSAITANIGSITAGSMSGVTLSIGSVNAIFKADTNGIYLGNATFASAPFRVDMNGNLTATSATLTGSITSTSGAIGGFTINATTLVGTNLTLDSGNQKITLGSANNILIMDAADTTYRLVIGNATYGSAPFRVDKAGNVTAAAITITGGSISSTPISGIPNNSSTDISLLGFSHNLTFTSVSATQVNWSSGTIVMSNGRTFSISSGNTGTMAAATYIYLDTGVSSTVLQTTTTYSTAMGANKILIATAQNNTIAASVIPFGGGQPVLDGVGNIAANSITAASIAANTITASQIAANTITASQIAANTITASQIAAGTITATQITVSTLSSLTANLGTITAGSITLNTTGFVQGGQTAYNTGTGFFLGYSSAAYKFSIGDGTSGNSLTWDGAKLTVGGYVVSGKGAFGGDGSDGALSISSGTTTIDCANAAVVTKNYTSISITGTGKLAFSNPNTNGTIIILKSMGGVTLTSSTAPMIDASGMGAAGGAGVAGGGFNNGISGSSGIGPIFTSSGGIGGLWNSSVANAGGLTSGVISSLAYLKYYQLLPGSGGGSGSAEGGTGGGTTAGGRGGAALVIECGGAWNFTTASGISVAGIVGGNSSTGVGSRIYQGSSGGGAGMFLGLYNTLTANSGTVTISGGGGGTGEVSGTGNANAGPSGGASPTTQGTVGNTANSSNAAAGVAGANGISIVTQNISFA